MSIPEARIQEDSNQNLSQILPHIASEIKISWLRDCDKTESMKTLNQIILDILNKENSLEEAINKDEKLLK